MVKSVAKDLRPGYAFLKHLLELGQVDGLNLWKINIFEHIKMLVMGHNEICIAGYGVVNKLVVIRIKPNQPLFLSEPIIHIGIFQVFVAPYLIGFLNGFSRKKVSQHLLQLKQFLLL